MHGLLCIGQLLCLICTLAYSEFAQIFYSKSEGTNTHHNGCILKEIAIPSGPGEPDCAIACLQTTGCESFTFEDSVCQLQKNGYGSWKGGKGQTVITASLSLTHHLVWANTIKKKFSSKRN